MPAYVYPLAAKQQFILEVRTGKMIEEVRKEAWIYDASWIHSGPHFEDELLLAARA